MARKIGHDVRPTSAVRQIRMSFVSGKTVTLNGNPAFVRGFGKPFALVTDTLTGLSAEWSWQAVRLIMSKGGAFKS